MNKRRVLWDTCCCLAFLRGEAGRVDLCDEVLERARTGQLEIVLSALALAETLNLPGHAKIEKSSRDSVRKFFGRSAFLVADVTRRIAERAQELVWEHNVRAKDAIHVATALEYSVPVLHTFDGGLQGLSRRLGASPKLLICEPGAEVSQLNLGIPKTAAERAAASGRRPPARGKKKGR